MGDLLRKDWPESKNDLVTLRKNSFLAVSRWDRTFQKRPVLRSAECARGQTSTLVTKVHELKKNQYLVPTWDLYRVSGTAIGLSDYYVRVIITTLKLNSHGIR